MRDLIQNQPILIEHREFNKVFSYVYYHDQELDIDYLFLNCSDGILRYNMEEKKITKKYPTYRYHSRRMATKCCIDPNDGIIYINLNGKNKIITFNIKSETWDFNYLNYTNATFSSIKFNRFLQPNQNITALAFLPNPINEVRLQISHQKDNSSKKFYNKIFKINKQRNFELVSTDKIQTEFRNSRSDKRLFYDPNYMDQHLYVLATQLINHPKINFKVILKNLFVHQRDYPKLKYVHLAYDQIIFFVHESRTGVHWVVDCVDAFEPGQIYFNVKSFLWAAGDSICFDHDNYMHHIYFNFQWEGHDMHSKISLMELIPKKIIQRNKKQNLSLIDKICSTYSRKHRMNIPTVLIFEISRFYPIFKSFK